MFNTRGGFSGQRPMGIPRMNQPGMNLSGMGLTGMGMSNMGMTGMTGMNQSNINLSGMNQPAMNSGMTQRIGLPLMGPNLGMSNMNQPGMNVYRMGPSGMNQGGMGFQSEIKGQGFPMRPMDSPGSFLGGNIDPLGMKNVTLRAPMPPSSERLMGSQALPPRFPGPAGPMAPVPPRMLLQNQEMPLMNRVTHSSDLLRGNPIPPFREPTHFMKEKPLNTLGMFGNLNQDFGMKSGPSSLEQMPGSQKRYTNESASSILQSFGLSNEDLEELSRYPDEQLTPGNLPAILKDIRLRKINRSGASHDQGRGGRRPGEVLPSKVIDYGHSSNFQFNNDSESSRPSRSFHSSRPNPKLSSVSKEPKVSSTSKTEQASENTAGNKIPTLCRRKPTLPASKTEGSNKSLLSEPPKKSTESSIGVSKVKSAAVTIQPDSTPLCDIPVILDTTVAPLIDKKAEEKIETVVNKGVYQTSSSVVPLKPSWEHPPSQNKVQDMKLLPTPSMMNDFFAASPRIFPHICSLCNIDCKNVKEWIQHQNHNIHIEKCRRLRLRYPDWNPQVHNLRNDGRTDETTPKRSKSKSGSPHRTRKSDSRHQTHRSHSRSPRPGRRSRSRSPRRARYSPRRSPHSPRRSPRSPLKSVRSPQRSQSPRRQRKAQSGSGPDKKAVDAAVQKFVEDSLIVKGEKARSSKNPSNGRSLPPKPKSSNIKGKKPEITLTKKTSSSSTVKKTSSSSSSSTAKKPIGVSANSSSNKKSNVDGSNSNKQPNVGGVSAPRKPIPSKSGPTSFASKTPVVSTGAKKTTSKVSSGKKPPPNKPVTGQKPSIIQKPPASVALDLLPMFIIKAGMLEKVLHVTNLPDCGYTDQDIINLVQPFGKVQDILVVRFKNEAFLKTSFMETAKAAVGFSETTPMMINHKQVTLSMIDLQKNILRITDLPDRSYTDQNIIDLIQPFGAVLDILTIHSKKEAYLKIDNWETAKAAIKSSETTPLMINNKQVKLSIGGPQMHEMAQQTVSINSDSIEKPSPIEIEDKDQQKGEKVPVKEGKNETPDVIEIPPGFVERFKLVDPPLEEDEKCVIVISNLPEKQYTEKEIANLAKPFGGANDILLISTHRMAYLQLANRSSVDSMKKFYSTFPTFLGGNSLNISMSSRYKDVTDEDRIFAELVENAPFEITPFIYKKFVYLTNLPDQEIEEFDITRIGLRFGKVEHYVVISNKRKAILHMSSVGAAKAMNSFLKLYPACIAGQAIKCSLPVKTKLNQDEYITVLEEEHRSEPEINLFDGEVAPTPDDVKREDLPTSPVSEIDIDEAANAAESCDRVSEDDDYEEAAEAPEAPVGAYVDFHPEPEVLQFEYNKVPQHYASEQTDVLVSVESDEEDQDTQGSSAQNTIGNVEHSQSTSEKACQREVVDEERDEDAAEAPECPPPTPRGPGKEKSGLRTGERWKTKSSSSTTSSRDGKNRSRSDRSRPNDNRTSSRSERGGSSRGRGKEKETAAGGGPPHRTAKSSAQKGETSATRTPDSRKRSSGERGSSGRETGAPKSSSNRSSPSENNQKSSSRTYWTKGASKNVGSPDRHSKVPSRSRESDDRSSSGRKDDRSKESSSSSSRYSRSTRGSTRSPRSKEEAANDDFPFNLDEFVTVDEIVEEHNDAQNKGNEEKKVALASTPRRGKRKETESPNANAKKAKEEGTESQDLSFVTLDEVGDEKNCAATSEASQTPEKQTTSVKARSSELLMVLEEVSGDEDVHTIAPEQPSTAPDILAKDQVLTLKEGEEQTLHSEPSTSERQLLEDKKNKPVDTSVDPDTKQDEDVPQPDQDRPTEQSLPTLNEDESIGDTQFLTVDEVGDEEEEAEDKKQGVEKTQSSSAIKKDTKPAAKTPPSQKGIARKRPIAKTTNGGKVVSPQTPTASTTVNQPDQTPTKGKEESNRVSTLDKTEPVESTSQSPETPAKKTKLDSPANKVTLESKEKTKLGSFSSSVPTGLEFFVPKAGFFCELCSLFYTDELSKMKHCKSLRHQQAVQKRIAQEAESAEGKTSST